MSQDVSDAGAHWLARARHSSSWAVWNEWLHGTWALVPTGHEWDVIAMPQRRLTGAAEHRPETWADVPVLADLGARYAHVWVPAGTHTTWDVPGTTALGHPWWIAVPRPGGPQIPERRWVQSPGRCPRLMDPDALRHALLAAPATATAEESA
ncbi:hypothetical protein ACFWV1_18430 [Streptomyces sp. NPDC058700]|uniref:hypothetical protein n=1 Tax=Streptomyces sp. NPDC058700 TaxID=3346607 RepID=UPI00365FF250